MRRIVRMHDQQPAGVAHPLALHGRGDAGRAGPEERRWLCQRLDLGPEVLLEGDVLGALFLYDVGVRDSAGQGGGDYEAAGGEEVRECEPLFDITRLCCFWLILS